MSLWTRRMSLIGLRALTCALALGVRSTPLLRLVTLRTTLAMISRPGLDLDLGGLDGEVLGDR